VDHQFATPEPITAVIAVVVGDVRITASDRQNTVVTVLPSNATNRADVSAAENVRVERGADRLSVKSPRTWRSWSPFSAGGSVELEIALPAGSRLDGEATLAGFRCAGPLGDCRLTTQLGAIELEQAAAVSLTTAVGDITVERVSGDAELTTGSGAVRAGAIGGDAIIKNSNGDTRVNDINGELCVKTANGDIAAGHARGSVVAKTARGDIRLDRADRGSIVAETRIGAIEIGIPEGTAAWLDLHTQHGHLYNALAAAEPPKPDDERVEVRARTAVGDITIRRTYPPAALEPRREPQRSTTRS
jgi:hypothetical protein